MLILGEVKWYLAVLYTVLITFPHIYNYFKFKSITDKTSNNNLEKLDLKLHISSIFLLQTKPAQWLDFSNHP